MSERWSNPLTVAIVAAALAGFSNAVIAFENNRAQLALETVKAESERILEMLRAGDPARVRENLRFLIELGLVQDEELRRRIEAWEANPRRAPLYLAARLSAAQNRAEEAREALERLKAQAVPQPTGSRPGY